MEGETKSETIGVALAKKIIRTWKIKVRDDCKDASWKSFDDEENAPGSEGAAGDLRKTVR